MSSRNGNRVQLPQGAGAPPQNLEAEQSVLGAVLLSDTALPALAIDERLHPTDFHREAHGIVFAAMLALHNGGEPVDAVTLVEHLNQAGKLEAAGGRAAIDLLASSVPAVGHVRQYARIVRENATLRRLLRATNEIQARVHSHDAPAGEQLELATQQISAVAATSRSGAQLVTRASAVPSRSIRWAWTGRLALGYLTVQTGIEGLGKSVFAAWMIAQLTRGKLDGCLEGKPTDVLVVAGEDGIADTWRPRLELAWADLDRVGFLNLDGLPPDWNLRDGITQLRSAIAETGARVVFIDAALDHMPPPKAGESINSPTFARSALGPLKRVVREDDLVGLFSMHPPKGKGADFRDLVQASQAFSAIPRIGLRFAYHPDDEIDAEDRRRVLLRGKGNIGRDPGALAFRVVGRRYRHDDGHESEREVVVNVTPCEVTMGDLAPDRVVGEREPTKQERAADFLRDALADGEWHKAAPFIEALVRDDIGARTTRYAADQLGVERRKSHAQDGPWEWRLRQGAEAATGLFDDTGAAALPLQPSRARDGSEPLAASPSNPVETRSHGKGQSGNDPQPTQLEQSKGQAPQEVARASDDELPARAERAIARHAGDTNGAGA